MRRHCLDNERTMVSKTSHCTAMLRTLARPRPRGHTHTSTGTHTRTHTRTLPLSHAYPDECTRPRTQTRTQKDTHTHTHTKGSQVQTEDYDGAKALKDKIGALQSSVPQVRYKGFEFRYIHNIIYIYI